MSHQNSHSSFILPSRDGYQVTKRFVFEATKHGPIFTEERNLQKFKKAWEVVYIPKIGWCFNFVKNINGSLKSYRQSKDNIPNQLKVQLAMLGVDH